MKCKGKCPCKDDHNKNTYSRHKVNEDNFVCGYDGITYNYKMADNAKQVLKHYFQNSSLLIHSLNNDHKKYSAFTLISIESKVLEAMSLQKE